MAVRPPQDSEHPTDGDDRPAGGTNPLSGPVLIWAIFIVVAVILAVIVAMIFSQAGGA